MLGFIFPRLIYIVLIPYLPEGDHMLSLEGFGWKYTTSREVQENLIMVSWGHGEDNDASEGKDAEDCGVPAFLFVCLLSCGLVCLFWFSSSLPINCVSLTPRPRARARGEASLSFNISFPVDISPLSSQLHLIPWADLRLDRESGNAVRWGSQKSLLYSAVCGWMGQKRPQTNRRR